MDRISNSLIKEMSDRLDQVVQDKKSGKMKVITAIGLLREIKEKVEQSCEANTS